MDLTKEQKEKLDAFDLLEKENEALKKKLESKAMTPASTFKVAKDASVSHSIEVESLEADIYHDNGDKFLVGEKNAIKLAEAKKVKIIGKFTDPELGKKAKSLNLVS
jgi:uncharacterized protein with von Willebrand factor type A (vWA) domain